MYQNIYLRIATFNQNAFFGIGTTIPTALLDVAGTASVSGTLTLGNGTTNTLRSPYGPLSFDYKSGAKTWGTAMTVDDITGYVGVGTTTPEVLSFYVYRERLIGRLAIPSCSSCRY